MSVMEYIAKFDRLTLLCDLEEKDHMMIARNLKGLYNNLERDLDLATYSTFEEVCKLALKVEKQRQPFQRPTPPPLSATSTPSNSTSSAASSTPPSTNSSITPVTSTSSEL